MLARAEEAALRQDGIAVVPDFLPEDEFAKVRTEARRAADEVAANIPVRQRKQKGFGGQEANAWGFDRYDGGTLNRFIDIDTASMPAIHAFSRNSRLARLCRAGLGMLRPPRRSMIYQTIHGDEKTNHDLQKDLHRDSCFQKMKYWYFLDPVGEDDGPFVYVPGSHRLTKQRRDWEAAQTRQQCATGHLLDRSYRISPKELAGLGLPCPQAMTVAANTLVIADTFGFHRRGDAKPGTSRLAIYGQKKPWPFAPIGV